ncbi:RRP12-like protein [Frankliniella occidentalis]|uniref:RRP12-like protein n=1 Tax=Frankliniella occidentalis TaxID=133901 RepID=A0A6J1TQP1_FRAOC|nr:RRP12-like protein [Frankliniella occidentalis]
MAKFRPRVKGKGKRWQKGHSSSSNPETKKFRDAARSRFFQENLVNDSKLTSDALRKHDAFMGTKPEEIEVDEEESEVGGSVAGKSFKTFQTFASDWSSCSNVSFSNFLKRFTANSALHKEMLAVLAAITEVIKSNGGTETSTEYFAALMTTLGVTESEDSLGAVLTLLGMGIKSVPQSVLRKKFSEASKTFMDLLERFADSENQVIMRSVLGCLSVLMRSQEAAVWKNSSTVQVLDSILAFTTHSKPKIRKAAQHAVCAILKSLCDSAKGEGHPAAPHVAKFCVRSLENSVGSVASQTTLLHTLYLVKETIATFPKQNLKTLCETVLKVMTLNNVLVNSCGMQALHSLFAARPSATILPSSLNAQLISALYDYQPPVSDAQPTLAWLAVMQEAHINLALQDLPMCCGHLPRLFTTVSQMWLSDKADVLSNTTHTLSAVISDCLKLAAAPDVVERHTATLSKVFNVLQEGLKYQYHSAWKHVIYLLGSFFEHCGATCENIILPCLTALGELQDSYQFACVHEVDHALGKAVTAMGPKAVLKAIPLQVTGAEVNNQIKRSWLLPILRESIRNTELGFFIEYFLPLATISWRKSKELSSQGRKAESVIYELFQAQTWSLLPSFCNHPTDIKDSFKNIAKVLGTVISDRKDLRLSVMSALRKLIICTQESEPSPKKEEDLKELARFAKNYVPILFNLYTTKANGSEEEGHRLAAYETIKVYLSIADSTLQNDLFERAFQKLKGEEVDKFIRESVMDLLRVLVPYQGPDNIAILYNLIKEGIAETKNNRYQKKSYRLLEVLCSSPSDICIAFQNEHLQDVQKLLLKSLSSSATTSRGARLRCLIHLVRRLPAKKANILKEIVPEAVLCVKDINERCRQSAFALLHELGLAMFRWKEEKLDNDDDEEDMSERDHTVIKDFLALILAGLAGSPQMTSATLLALADVTHHFKSQFPDDLLQLLLENVCLLATSPTREVAGSAISYLKQFVYSFPATTVGPYVPAIMKAFVTMTDDCKRHFRRETQHMLDRMMRKYGCDAIERQVPGDDEIMLKRVRNLRKLHARKQRVREERLKNKLAVEDSDDEEFSVKARAKSIEEILAESDDELDLEKKESTSKGAKKKSQTWIKEEPGDIMDLADTMAASKISASKPSTSTANGMAFEKSSKKDKNRGFKTAPDGRLIIADNDNDSSDEEGKRKIKGSKRIPTVSDSESDDDNDQDNDGDAMSSRSGPTVKGRKRKLSANTDARSTTTAGPSAKYQAGGSGIHRPTSTAMSVKSGASGKTAATGKSSASNAFGSEYRSKKAKGDVKKKGAPDPYAYVPLNRALLNKRKKLKQAGQFKGLVRAARKGAAAGRVAKTRVSRK